MSEVYSYLTFLYEATSHSVKPRSDQQFSLLKIICQRSYEYLRSHTAKQIVKEYLPLKLFNVALPDNICSHVRTNEENSENVT